MFKKMFLVSMVLFFIVSVAWADLSEPTIYPVYPPTTEHHIEQIKWAYNQGYVYGILASYGLFLKVNYQKNFVLPIIKVAWEKGYVEGVIHVYEIDQQGGVN